MKKYRHLDDTGEIGKLLRFSKKCAASLWPFHGFHGLSSPIIRFGLNLSAIPWFVISNEGKVPRTRAVRLSDRHLHLLAIFTWSRCKKSEAPWVFPYYTAGSHWNGGECSHQSWILDPEWGDLLKIDRTARSFTELSPVLSKKKHVFPEICSPSCPMTTFFMSLRVYVQEG